MKRFILFTTIAFLAVGTAQAAEFSTDVQPPTGPSGPSQPAGDGAVNITQNTDPNTVGTGSIACSGDGGVTVTDNQFLRRFFLNADHGISTQFNVTDVSYGVQTAEDRNIGGRPINATLTLYSIANGAAFTYANMTSVGSAALSIPDQTTQVVLNQAVTGSIIDPVSEDLVVEVANPDYTGEFAFFFGSNDAGQTQPSYLASVSCGFNDPTTFANIGFPDVHIIYVVSGDEQVVPTPTPPPATAGEPVPAMNRYGIMVMIGLLIGVAILVMWRRS
ncbi:MAG: hypothetical protein PVG53_09060 [Holophagae bacterium]|jgi:hypothetical protein